MSFLARFLHPRRSLRTHEIERVYAAHGISEWDVERANHAIEEAARGGPMPNGREIARIGAAYQSVMMELERRGLVDSPIDRGRKRH